MHELSISYSIVDIASEALRQSGASPPVTAVRLRIGALSGIARSALEFSYELACVGTLLEGSRLEFEELPLVIFCQECQQTQILPGIQSFRCPVCQAPSADIRQGEELEVDSVICQ